jgi:hypothetical protein
MEVAIKDEPVKMEWRCLAAFPAFNHLKMQEKGQLTFIHDKEDIRWLNAGNAARHRHSISNILLVMNKC